MDKRMVEFIRALRAAGVRISLAESQDAMFGVEAVGASNRDFFRSVLRTTLVKEGRDHQTFDYFFPLFFGSGVPPMQNIPDNLSPEDQQRLQEALRALMGDTRALRQLLQQLLQGRPFSQEQLDQMGQQAGLDQGSEMYQRHWFERRMNRQAGMQQLQELIEQLLEELRQMGMSDQALQELREMLQQNAEGLSEQISNYVGATLAQQMAQQEPQPKPDLLDVPFTQLGQSEVDAIRDEIRRLAARLRSRASLRQKRANAGDMDPRRVMRHNMRYGSVPIELQFRTRHVKPRLVLICDVSTSMRYCAEFLLTLIYELQDQVARTDSFIFISDLADISMVFKHKQPQEAVGQVLSEHRPGYYNTDLGNSLNTFKRDHMDKITGKTTVIILGDGRNNYNDPRLDIAQDMQRRARRLLWFCPEPPALWGTGDSDMHRYAPLANGVFKVSTLRELASAVDQILTDG
ncbi:MAG: VWA domain-containing protein [Chloroflexi bacterium]|nr:VWA domain-containing protein [Chloroflexota bacterium]MDL1884253.1 VWA domain-containing protein [Anaerolineae bacterium CFX8]